MSWWQPPITNSWSLLKLMSIESMMPSSHLILCRPLLLPTSVFPSIRVFSNESVLPIRWPKYWSFSFSISPSNEYSGLISFRMDWLDQFFGAQLSLCSNSLFLYVPTLSFFMFQLSLSLCSNSHIHTGKTIALSRQTMVGQDDKYLNVHYSIISSLTPLFNRYLMSICLLLLIL